MMVRKSISVLDHCEAIMSLYTPLKILHSSQRNGTICLCTHVSTNETFAMKTIAKSTTSSANRPVYEKLLNLPYHPNLMQVYDVYEDPAFYYLILERLEGGDLHQYLNKSRGFYEGDYKRIMYEVLSGLAHLHNNGLIHRDIKPENLMWLRPPKDHYIAPGIARPGACTKIVDIDTCLIDGTSSGRVFGTPGFMAPEVWLERGPSRSTDLFSVGVTLYLMVTHHMPFNQEIFTSRYYKRIKIATDRGIMRRCLCGAPRLTKHQVIFKAMQAAEVDFSAPHWSVMRGAQDLVKLLIAHDYTCRPISVQAVMTHDWFKGLFKIKRLSVPDDDEESSSTAKRRRSTRTD